MLPDGLPSLDDLTFDAGQMYERHRIAELRAELDAVWRPIGRISYEQRIRDRIGEMEHHAARIAEQMGRPAGYRYTGGPVPWVPAWTNMRRAA